MRWRRPRFLCSHARIDEIYDSVDVAEDLISGVGRTDYVGHCAVCDRTVSWSETL